LSRLLVFVLVTVSTLGVSSAQAEPIFISRQYARCTTCHYSPTGGGLLTPYGRSLSRQELSTMGRSPSGTKPGREEQFLYGALGNTLGPVQVGIDLRPSHLNVDYPGGSSALNLLMTADLLAAYRRGDWTIYGELGREPRPEGATVVSVGDGPPPQGAKIASYEHWVSHQPENGIGFRVGRFLPAYGVRLADHTAFTRADLGFDAYDQVYALELSRAGERSLAQVSLGPGRAESILHDDGRRTFTATGRFQLDLTPRTVVVASGLYRNESKASPRSGAFGLAFGFAPRSHLSIWTEGDAHFQSGTPGPPSYILLNETSFEVYRGLWIGVSPQLRTAFGDSSNGVVRLALNANLLPRTHWNIGLSFYRDRTRANDLVTKTFLAQLHLYL
jgi:hypothetical protein